MPYEGYEYYYGRELVLAVPPDHTMSVEVTYDATDVQAVEIKDLYLPDRHIVRFCSAGEDGSGNAEPFELANPGPKERKLIMIGGSRNSRKWWLSTPIVRWHENGLVVGFSDRHERAMNEPTDGYKNITVTIRFEPIESNPSG